MLWSIRFVRESVFFKVPKIDKIDKKKDKMENLAADYLNFARPPLAPVFRPTEKEFRDPIAYVAKIRAEAEPYGVVKIIPPEVSWVF